jgi:fatty-acyl-CoA synthase
MKGLMQNWPLLVPTILDHAKRWHGEQEIVTRTVEGAIHRYTYADLYSRTKRCANALRRLAVREGDVIATMAWNTHRHMEIWYAIMGSGAICHTINPRLFRDQLIYIANHAEDKYLFLDSSFVSVVEEVQEECPGIRGYILMTDREHMPETSLRDAMCYEELIADEGDEFDWASVDEENACGLCYTSGTTGNPKGVLYSHRSNVIHALAANGGDGFDMKAVDTVLPVVPMFHANAWALIFAAPMVGAKLVMPGSQMDGASIHELLEGEQVTLTAAVPTVWLMLLQHLEGERKTLTSLKRLIVGGSACPQTLIESFEKNHGFRVDHAWGMTEMEVPCDGQAFGHLVVRGPAISRAYLKGEGGKILDDEGFFDTGDVATIDELGFMQITDRAKDVIKSGGEWISSIELENVAVGHPEVTEAAVIGIAHPKWDERPLLVVVRKAGSEVTKAEILSYIEGKIAKWWMPDDVVFADEIPHTATGKIHKLSLREQFKNHVLPTARESSR